MGERKLAKITMGEMVIEGTPEELAVLSQKFGAQAVEAPTEPLPLYREVKRKAGVGERIRIVKATTSLGYYKNGDEFTVTGEYYGHGVGIDIDAAPFVYHEEYVVLEAEPPKPQRLAVGGYAKVATVCGGVTNVEIGDIVKITRFNGCDYLLSYETLGGKRNGMYGYRFVPATDEEVAEAKRKAAKPNVKVGDYVRITEYQSAAPVGTIVKVTGVSGDGIYYDYDGYRGFGADLDHYEPVTPAEVDAYRQEAEAAVPKRAEEAKWAKIGRKVNEYKRGDVVSFVRRDGGKGVGTVEDAAGSGNTIGVRLSAETHDGSIYKGVFFDGGDVASLIVPVEQRFDIGGDAQ